MSNPGWPSATNTSHGEIAGNPEFTSPILLGSLKWLDRRSAAAVCIAGGLMIVGIGVLSLATGPQLSSSLLYLIPLLFVTRVAGLRVGIPAAAFAAAVWLVVDLRSGINFGHPFAPYWNALMRLGTFLVAVSLVAAMRSLNNQLEKRVHDRTAALEAQVIETRELEQSILEISDRERATIGQDLHDGLCQQLVSASFSATLLQEELSKSSTPGIIHANHIAEMIDDAITQARNLARGLYPVRLETEGLEMALRELASSMSRRFDVPCVVDCPDPVPPCSPTEGIHLYRIAQEAAVNAAKHAGATRITMNLSSVRDQIKLAITDDGIGMESKSLKSDGMGLRIMEYRSRMIDAAFQVSSIEGGGTRVICELEVDQHAAPHQFL